MLVASTSQISLLAVLFFRACAAQTAGTVSFAGSSLSDTGCYGTVADGGWGYCGPASCQSTYITCQGPATVSGVTGTWLTQGGTTYSASNCQSFLSRTATADNTNWNPPGSCDSTCTQATTGVCSGTFLANVLKGTGVKYAFCNDKVSTPWLEPRTRGVMLISVPRSSPRVVSGW
jgi:hypothetical protein